MTRRKVVLGGIVTAAASTAGPAAATTATSSEGVVTRNAKATRKPPKSRMRIISLEEHVHDPIVAEAGKEAFASEVPYMGDIGRRYREDPDHGPHDRPRLTFIPRSIQTAAQPLSARLPAMDAAGIDFQVVSLTNQAQLAPPGSAVDVARGANDRLAAAVAANPGRFSAFFTLPWQDPVAAVREAERCVRELKLTATLLTGRPADVFLDDVRFDPVLAKLAELDAPLYVHPGPTLRAVREPYYAGFNPDLSARLSLFGWGWHQESGIQVVRLILSGALDRHRNLKLISGHWGEMVPFFLQRMDDAMPPQVTGLSRTISQTYRDQVWVGPSGMLDTPHFMFVREVVGMNRLVFSIDYPFLTMDGARHWLETLPVPQADKEAFAFRNAEALLRMT